MPKIVLGMTTYRTQMHPMATWGLMGIAARGGYDVVLPPLKDFDGLGVDTRRNNVVRYAKKASADAIFFVDSDTQVPPEALATLYRDCYDWPIAFGLVAQRVETRTAWVLLDGLSRAYVPAAKVEKLEADGIVRVPVSKPSHLGPGSWVAGGAACLLVRKIVWETVCPPWFERQEDDDSGRGVGGDLYFYTKCAEAGLFACCDFRVKCKHWHGDKSYPVETKGEKRE